MPPRSRFRLPAAFLSLLALTAAAGWFLTSGAVRGGDLTAASAGALRKPTGQPQMVAVEELPVMDGATSEWMPASASFSLQAARQQNAVNHSDSPSEAAKAAASQRKPVRTLVDSFPSYSSIAVDPIRNEVVMTDESQFSIMVYNREANPPPQSRMTEPKRWIRGPNTDIEFQCGIYIDPGTGDIYSVNNDTQDKLIVFPNQANGDVAPARSFKTPHSTYGIVVDEKTQELFLTVQDNAAIVVYKKDVHGDAPALRTLQGSKTLLADPHGITHDTKRDLIFVANWGSYNEHRLNASFEQQEAAANIRSVRLPNWPLGPDDVVPGAGKFMPPSITVYPRTASGDTAPVRLIQGPKTQLNWPSSLSFDPERNELFVANDPESSILVFDGNASGDVAPVRVLQGPRTLLQNTTGIWVDLKNDELWAANFGNHTATVYKRTASGDTPPLRVIRSAPLNTPAPMMGNPHTIAYDNKRDEILVAN